MTLLFSHLTRRIKGEKYRADAEAIEAASQSAATDTESTTDPSSSAITSNTPTIEVTKVVDEDSGEVEEVSSPKRQALDSSAVTAPEQKAAAKSDDEVDTTTATVD